MDQHQDQVDMIEMPSGRGSSFVRRPPLNLGNATGHPSFVMSASFTNQVLAQIELWTKGDEYAPGVYILPKALDEKVAGCIWTRSASLTQLSPEQASISGSVAGPVQVGPLSLLIAWFRLKFVPDASHSFPGHEHPGTDMSKRRPDRQIRRRHEGQAGHHARHGSLTKVVIAGPSIYNADSETDRRFGQIRRIERGQDQLSGQKLGLADGPG